MISQFICLYPGGSAMRLCESYTPFFKPVFSPSDTLEIPVPPRLTFPPSSLSLRLCQHLLSCWPFNAHMKEFYTTLRGILSCVTLKPAPGHTLCAHTCISTAVIHPFTHTCLSLQTRRVLLKDNATLKTHICKHARKWARGAMNS